MRLTKLLILLFGGINFLFAQEEQASIALNNPSFEDIPQHSHAPRGWMDCGFPGETAPDTQPSGFKVMKEPYHGRTYLGMVVRDNDTWESVSQQLSMPLQKGVCYEISLHLSRSELYVSPSKISGKDTNYTTPAKLRIYGGFNHCNKQYLLAESKLIINTRWIEYNFKLEPIDDYTHITFEAFYKTPTLFPYNGNILMDNISAITPIPCDESTPTEPEVEEPVEEVIAEVPQENLKSKKAPQQFLPPSEEAADPTPKEPTARLTPPTNSKPEKEVSIGGFKRSQLKKGQIIKIEKLFFQVDKAEIQESSYEELDGVYSFLEQNKDVVVEIGGHTNGVPTEHWWCDSLSTARARSVATYLSDRGISMERLKYKGYGKRKPLYSNKTVMGRRKNQRVEIKILNMDAGEEGSQ